MTHRILLVVLWMTGTAGLAEARSVPLFLAPEQQVDVDVVSPGGYHEVTITLRNRGEAAATVTGAPGMILENRSASEQDLTLSGPVTMTVGPGQTVSRVVGAYCIRAERSSPSPGAHFVARSIDEELGAMIRGRESTRNDGSTQSAVWAFMRQRAEQAPQVEMTCVGSPGGLRLCVNNQARPADPLPTLAPAPPPTVAPVPPPPIAIPIIQLPTPAAAPPPAAPVVRRQRPRVRPHQPPAPIARPDPHEPQGLVIEDD